MDEKLFALIDQLAAKLGIVVEHLWGVMLKQAYISAIIDLSLLTAIWIGCVLLWKKYSSIPKPDSPDDDSKIMLLLGCLFITAVVVAITPILLPSTLTGLFNPEYWALQQIMKLR